MLLALSGREPGMLQKQCSRRKAVPSSESFGPRVISVTVETLRFLNNHLHPSLLSARRGLHLREQASTIDDATQRKI